PSFSEGVRTIKLPQPVIAQSLQVLLITRQRLSSCLTPTLYGCDALEVIEGKRHKYLSKDDILILDEKPN
ncbi:hypothetical protein pdam_00009417, partial [Pocillopora damicornis]